MRKGNWIPLDKSLAKTLPKLRPFSEVEAAFSLSLDYNSDKTVTVSGYSGQWGWSRKRVKNFLEDMGVEIVYPQDTKCKKNQRGHIALHKRNIKGTYKGHIRMIDSKDIQGDGDIKGTYREHKRDIKGSATINPKYEILNPKTNPPNPPNPPLDDEPFSGDLEEEPDGRPEVQDAFHDCRNILGLSDTEIQEFYNRHSEENRFAEAVQFAVEKTEKDGALEKPLGFMAWAYKNSKTSLRTRGKACKSRNGERKTEQNLVIGAPDGWQTVQ